MKINHISGVLAATVLGLSTLMAPAVNAQTAEPAPTAQARATASPDQARSLQQRGQWNEAAEAWQSVLAHNARHGEAAFNLGYCLHMAGRLDEALPAHRHAAEFDEFRGIALYNVACAHALLGEPEAALGALVRSGQEGFDISAAHTDSDFDSLRADPRFNAILSSSSNRGGFLARLNNFAGQARALYTAYAPQVQREIGALGDELGQRAQLLAGRVMQDPRLAPIAMRAMRLIGGPEEAQAASAPSARAPQTQVAPSAPAPSLQRAQQLQNAQDWGPAAATYGAVLAADSDNVAALFGHAYCLHMAGNYEAAITAHKRAAESPQIRGIALYNLGCAYALTGKPDEAFKALRASHEAGFEVKDHLDSDADLKSLREDPRFTELKIRVSGGL